MARSISPSSKGPSLSLTMNPMGSPAHTPPFFTKALMIGSAAYPNSLTRKVKSVADLLHIHPGIEGGDVHSLETSRRKILQKSLDRRQALEGLGRGTDNQEIQTLEMSRFHLIWTDRGCVACTSDCLCNRLGIAICRIIDHQRFHPAPPLFDCIHFFTQYKTTQPLAPEEYVNLIHSLFHSHTGKPNCSILKPSMEEDYASIASNQ